MTLLRSPDHGDSATTRKPLCIDLFCGLGEAEFGLSADAAVKQFVACRTENPNHVRLGIFDLSPRAVSFELGTVGELENPRLATGLTSGGQRWKTTTNARHNARILERPARVVGTLYIRVFPMEGAALLFRRLPRAVLRAIAAIARRRCDVIGFDIEQHVYGDERYPAQLVLQDVCTIHGKQFKDADIIVASSPCQKYSYMAMPWTKAKDLAKWYRDPAHPERLAELNTLFEQPKRIQREAIAAAGGRFIPLIQENVRGAIPWVGRSQWHYGSFHLWGDVPALMPTTLKAVKVGNLGWSEFAKTGVKSKGFNTTADQIVHGRKSAAGSYLAIDSAGVKMGGGSWFGDYTPKSEGVKQGGDWFNDPKSMSRQSSSKSTARKAASAKIAKIPFPLASHIAHVYRERAS